MAGLSDVIRNAVAIADNVTQTLQATVKHAAFDGTYTRSGTPNHKSAVTRKALIEKKQQLVTAVDGTDKTSQTKLTFVSSVSVNVLDKITLPDNSSPKILALESPLDDSGNAFVTTVWF